MVLVYGEDVFGVFFFSLGSIVVYLWGVILARFQSFAVLGGARLGVGNLCCMSVCPTTIVAFLSYGGYVSSSVVKD